MPANRLVQVIPDRLTPAEFSAFLHPWFPPAETILVRVLQDTRDGGVLVPATGISYPSTTIQLPAGAFLEIPAGPAAPEPPAPAPSPAPVRTRAKFRQRT